MSAALVVTGLVLLGLPGLRWLPSGQLHPAEWARASAGALRLGHASVRLGLLLGAAPSLLHGTGFEHAAVACHRLFGPVAPGGPVAGWLSAAGWAWLTLNRRRALRAQQRGFDAAHVEGWIGEHRDRCGVDVVILPVDQPLAYAVPRGPGQIVVSGALTATLDPAELDAVIAHEASHLHHRHHRHAAVAAAHHACFGRVPFLRSSADVLRLAVERWADEDAAPCAHDRDVIRAALTKTTERMLGPALAFTATGTVLDRLAALDEGPPSPSASTRVAALAPLAVLSASVVAVLGAWGTYGYEGLLGIVGVCLG